MSEYKLKVGKIGNTVINNYKKIENGVVSGYKKIEKKFVDSFLEEVDSDKKSMNNNEQQLSE